MRAANYWKRTPISNTYLGLFDGPHATPKPSDEGPVFLGIGNITEDGHLDLGNVRHIAEEDFPQWTKRVEPRPGDIVFTYEATLNRYAIIPEGFRGCLGRRLALIRPNPSVVDTRFLHFYFFSEDWRTTIASNILAGATVERIPLTKFPDFPVSLPPLAAQRRIASILSAYDDLIENNTRRIAILEEMARRIYEEWFVRFRYPGHDGVRMVESALGPVPEGWAYEPLGSLLAHHIGGGWGQEEPSDEHSVPAYVIRGTDIPDVRFMSLGRSPLRYHTPSNFRSRKLESRDIVFEVSGGSKDQPVGRAVMVPELLLKRSDAPVICASFCRLVRADASQILPELLRFHFDRIYESRQIMQYQTQSTGITNFKFTVFIDKEAVLKPSRAVQDMFAEKIYPMLRLSESLGVMNTNLRTTRDLLLPKLISGDLDVSELPLPEAIAA